MAWRVRVRVALHSADMHAAVLAYYVAAPAGAARDARDAQPRGVVWSTTTDPEGVRLPARRLAFLCAATAGGVRDKTLKLGREPGSMR